ncbi:MAG: alpha/beta hydrolase [Melioribacteraceae bacterium]|nr:alpha/beta hydrolase [Melioribacteraceae bacterium]
MKISGTITKKIIRYLLSILIAYAAYATFFYLIQRTILFPTSYARTPMSVADQIPDSLKTWIKTEYEISESWYFPPFSSISRDRNPLVIIGHGNADVIDRWVGAVSILREYGMGVMLVEYPGYGRSTGDPSEESIQRVFVASYDSIISRRDIDPNKIVLLGQSIGGGAVCNLAKQRPASAIILVSSFTNVSVLASDFLIPGFLVKDTFNNLAVIKDFDGPTLFIHGIEDDLIPFSESQKLYSAASSGTLVSIEGGHNLNLHRSGFWEKHIIPFLIEENLTANDK